MHPQRRAGSRRSRIEKKQPRSDFEAASFLSCSFSCLLFFEGALKWSNLKKEKAQRRAGSKKSRLKEEPARRGAGSQRGAGLKKSRLGEEQARIGEDSKRSRLGEVLAQRGAGSKRIWLDNEQA